MLAVLIYRDIDVAVGQSAIDTASNTEILAL